jgi:hypothetical protein
MYLPGLVRKVVKGDVRPLTACMKAAAQDVLSLGLARGRRPEHHESQLLDEWGGEVAFNLRCLDGRPGRLGDDSSASVIGEEQGEGST